MPNSWFQFKQFMVRQDRCAMKVSTDACIQGAWAARYLQRQAGPLHVLDIGTGTGLLSLMLAQEAPQAQFLAIELHEAACKQAAENFAASPWADRLQAHHTALNDLAAKPEHHTRYDFIICNPPFFHNHLAAKEAQRNDARHSAALDKPALAGAIAQLLGPSGTCCILYPATEWSAWEQIAAAYGLYPHHVLEVQPSLQHRPNRVAGIFGRGPAADKEAAASALVIYEPDRRYTTAFAALLRPYYLAL